jgi:hypothetical protein
MTTCPGRPGTASTTRSWVGEEGSFDNLLVISEFAIFSGSKAPGLSVGCALDRSLTWGGMELSLDDLFVARVRTIDERYWVCKVWLLCNQIARVVSTVLLGCRALGGFAQPELHQS